MDAVSYAHSAKQAKRIKKFIENPDSNSGIVTVPKVIGAGENVTVPAGRVAVLPNVQVDGTLNIEGEVFIPSGSSIDMGNGLAINGEKVVMSVPTSYHLLQGNLAVDNTVITQGFNTTLYTGNGTTQSINTGIDMDTQWGNTAEEKFGGLVWTKSRSSAISNILIDTVRGNKSVFSNETTAESSASRLTSFNSNGFSLSSDASINGSSITYASWNFQTTHRISGVTNHGKAYTCHYNPFTGFTIVKYEGSGIGGHEIPHHLGRKLGFTTIKQLNGTNGWLSQYKEKSYLYLQATNAEDGNVDIVTSFNTANTTLGVNAVINTSTSQYILYGWANSYFDEANKLIGNYEVGVYQGTGAAGNKVTTRGKPAWVMIKRLDSTGDWTILDNMRSSMNNYLYSNSSSAEVAIGYSGINQNGFTLNGTTGWALTVNASGGQYLYMVAYDTNSDGGGSYYPKATDTANVQINNALIPIAKGSDINGLKNVMLSKNETITGLTYTAGKNYIYYDGNGNKGVKSVAPNYGVTNPINGGDFYNILKNKWYTSDGVEIPEGRNYLNHILHADNDGGVLYTEELPKIEYKDVIKANEYQGKNACTAWIAYDLTTTPVTILGTYGFSSVVRTATGLSDAYFLEDIDATKYSATVSFFNNISFVNSGISIYGRTNKKISINSIANGVSTNFPYIAIQIFGGRN